jgi:hypothetical protein
VKNRDIVTSAVRAPTVAAKLLELLTGYGGCVIQDPRSSNDRDRDDVLERRREAAKKL